MSEGERGVPPPPFFAWPPSLRPWPNRPAPCTYRASMDVEPIDDRLTAPAKPLTLVAIGRARDASHPSFPSRRRRGARRPRAERLDGRCRTIKPGEQGELRGPVWALRSKGSHGGSWVQDFRAKAFHSSRVVDCGSLAGSLCARAHRREEHRSKRTMLL